VVRFCWVEQGVDDPAERVRVGQRHDAGSSPSWTRRPPRGRVTFAEVEESEADLARFQAWLAKIARDYFAAPLGERVRAELDRAGQLLAAFEAAALAADTTVASAPADRGAGRRLWTVPGQPR
jgi:hypothetical protein